MSMKNFNETVGKPTRDLPACSAVPHPTELPRALLLELRRTLNLLSYTRWMPKQVKTWKAKRITTWQFCFWRHTFLVLPYINNYHSADNVVVVVAAAAVVVVVVVVDWYVLVAKDFHTLSALYSTLSFNNLPICNTRLTDRPIHICESKKRKWVGIAQSV